ncbi:Hypothetical predicted protein [Lecanosticta acicola]|uniref:FAM192A/Fyv6 N-terminal domain-containing protein n=1 Tax=Lecanosticta acicola TaxID=111012 RepID=A0AAI8Z8Y4_9PEZI|nr:Hypothetical predicted protein [Lecanosticta acicola]
MSRFVSGGTDDELSQRDGAWLKAQQEIEAKRLEADIGKQQDGKSLYETLQANKAAKQEQFEQSIRLSNQFQTLNEDEVEFLDSVLESTRAQEAAVKKQTAEDLDAFRRQQEEAERAAKTADTSEAVDAIDTTSWAVSRKRKKGREDLLGGVKLRKASSGDKVFGDGKQAGSESTPALVEGMGEKSEAGEKTKTTKADAKDGTQPSPVASPRTSPATAAPGLGLGAYSSDDDD